MPRHEAPLARAIEKEHAHMKSRLALLKRELRALAENQKPDFDLLDLLAQFFTTFPDEIHHKKEDLLYDALIERGILESDYLKRLRREHEQMDALTKQFSKNLYECAVRGQPTKTVLLNSIDAYIDLQELHMADEESQFLPLVEKELSEECLAQINEKIQQELITDAARDSFRALAEIDKKIDQIAPQGAR